MSAVRVGLLATLVGCSDLAEVFEPQSSGDPLGDGFLGPSVTPPEEWGVLTPPTDMPLQSAYCWFVVSDYVNGSARLRVMGMDSGQVATVHTWEAAWDVQHHTLAFDGSHFVLGLPGPDLSSFFRVIDAETGDIEDGVDIPEAFMGPMWVGDHWRVQRYATSPFPPTLRFETLDDLLAGDQTSDNGFDGAEVLHARQGEVFGTDIRGDALLRFQPNDATAAQVTPLAEFDDFVAGFATAADEVFVMDRGNHDPREEGRAFLHRFASDGTLLSRFPAAPAPFDPSGPWCESFL
jgi:hypothetical protein